MSVVFVLGVIAFCCLLLVTKAADKLYSILGLTVCFLVAGILTSTDCDLGVMVVSLINFFCLKLKESSQTDD